MKVQVRHIDGHYGDLVGDIKPSELQPLIDFFKSGVPVYDYADEGFEDCRYYNHQIIRDNAGSPYVLEIIVDGPAG